MNLQTWVNPHLMLACAAALLLAMAIGLLGWLHRAAPEHHPLHDAVSLYGAGVSAAGFRLYVHLGTAGIALFTWLVHLQRNAAVPPVVVFSLVVLLAARVAIAAVPTDAKGEKSSARGRAHLALAVIVFAAGYTALDNATPSFAALPFFAALSVLRWVCAGSLVAVVATMLLPGKRYFGLAERGFLVSMLLWFLVASLSLFGAPSAT